MTLRSQSSGTTICIGGSIAVGKSTFIDRLKSQTDAMGISCHFMPELLCPTLNAQLPINPQLFDTFIISHRLQMCLDALHIAKSYSLVIMERCHIDHLAFLLAFDKIGGFPREHTNWVRQIIKEINPPLPDHFVYLDVSPELAFSRMCKRSETRDANFNLDFVTALIEGYEQVIQEHGLKGRLLKLDWSDFGTQVSLPQIFSSLSL
jgi:thymidylate kinase